MSDGHPDTDEVASSAHKFLEQTLRSTYPWMEPEAIERIVGSQVTELKKQLLAEEQAMAQSRKRINFFDLPAELRTVIYEHALGQKERIRVPKSASPSLLRTCTQIRNEASSIYYSTNSFQARVTHAFDNRAPGEAENSLKKWLQAIGSKRAGQIEKLHVKYLVSSDGFLSLPREEWAFVFREKDMHDLLGLEEFGVPQEHVVIEFQILSDEY